MGHSSVGLTTLGMHSENLLPPAYCLVARFTFILPPGISRCFLFGAGLTTLDHGA